MLTATTPVMCEMEEPIGVRTKEVLWIQCSKCQHWYYQYVFLSKLHLISNLSFKKNHTLFILGIKTVKDLAKSNSYYLKKKAFSKFVLLYSMQNFLSSVIILKSSVTD